MADFSPATLELFKMLLDQATLSAGAPDFEAVAFAVAGARRELTAAMEGLVPAATNGKGAQPQAAR